MAKVTFFGPGHSDPEAHLLSILREALPSEATMIYAGERQVKRIKERTQAGRDVNGEQFQPYSKKYAEFRQKKGRNVVPVDLLMSGRMQGSMRVEVRGPAEFAITIGDPDAAVYAQAHNEGSGHQPQRRFFDTSQAELDAIGTDLVDFEKAG